MIRSFSYLKIIEENVTRDKQETLNSWASQYSLQHMNFNILFA